MHWKPILEKLRNGLQSKDAARRAESEKALSQITDRQAVPMVWATFGRGDASLKEWPCGCWVRSMTLPRRGHSSCWRYSAARPDVRRKAIETLTPARCPRVCRSLDRDDTVNDQVRSQEGRRSGPAGRTVDQGAGVDAQREASLFTAGEPRRSLLQPGDRVVLDENGLARDRSDHRNDERDDEHAHGHGGGTTVCRTTDASAATRTIAGHARPQRIGKHKARESGEILINAAEMQAASQSVNLDGSPSLAMLARVAYQIRQPVTPGPTLDIRIRSWRSNSGRADGDRGSEVGRCRGRST